MSFLDQWPFKNRQKQEKEAQDFERMCFPLGPGQRERLQAVLVALVKARMSREEKLFAYLVAKEMFLAGEGSEGAVVQVDNRLRQLRLKDAGDRRVVIALLRLDTALTDLADFPSPEVVLARALLEE